MQEETVRRNLLQIQEDIAPCKPNIIAVTKYFDGSAIVAAYNVGLRNFGESRAVEAIKKIEELPDEIKSNSTFHFIGHLQSNKVKKVVNHFEYIHSVDTFEIAQKISDEALAISKVQKIFIELNLAGEEQKSGFSKDEIFTNFEKLKDLKGIQIVGIMSMAPLGASEDELENLFEDVIKTKNELNEKFNCNMQEISMGMSQDYKIAAKKGATYLRIGRKLFK
ncbi:MAG: YggS family pyridoxal phosphate-dependent enzyme [Clostridiaceae bacterium]|jgi:PLP dependent protein|nr:YggS family pyridoxal phosphate-dependent enzyme [Clostridiaceae bacterium]